jgi:glutamate carboxypeptidase
MTFLSSHARRLAYLVYCFALPSTLLSQSSATLTSVERSITGAVDSHNAEALSLLERLVNINSGTLNLAGVRQVGDVLRAQFDALGFTTRWVDGAPFQRSGHLVAEHPGPGQKILLIGHLDTVFEPNNPFQKFQRINDSTAKGPGHHRHERRRRHPPVRARALKDAGALDKMNVTVVFNGDEEEAGTPIEAARKTLIDAAKGASAALGSRTARVIRRRRSSRAEAPDRGRCARPVRPHTLARSSSRRSAPARSTKHHAFSTSSTLGCRANSISRSIRGSPLVARS